MSRLSTVLKRTVLISAPLILMIILVVSLPSTDGVDSVLDNGSASEQSVNPDYQETPSQENPTESEHPANSDVDSSESDTTSPHVIDTTQTTRTTTATLASSTTSIYRKTKPTVYLDNYPAPNKDDFGIEKHIELGELDLYDLVNHSDVIVLGKIGQILDYDYPLSSNDNNSTNCRQLDYDEYFASHPRGHAFHQIHIDEIWKGSPSTPFVIGRIDIENKACFNDMALLEEDQSVLLFATFVGYPKFETDSVGPFYTVGGDNGIFDIDNQFRAFPRIPHFFTDAIPDPHIGEQICYANDHPLYPECTDNLDLVIGVGDLNPHIDLSELKVVVDRYLQTINNQP